jgi:hypothetical protein
VNTLLVKANGILVCAIDAPDRAEEFIATAKKQIENAKMARVSQGIPRDILETHQAKMYLLGGSSPANVFMAGGNPQARMEQMMQQQLILKESNASPILVAEMVREDTITK